MEPSENPEKPAPAAAEKKAVSPELLERLAKAREVAAEKRRALKEKREMAQAYLQQPKDAGPSDGPPKDKRKPAKAPEPDSGTESDSSVSSSDTSDSEADEVNKRGGRKKKIRDRKQLQHELEKAKEKYRTRYQMRYQILRAAREPAASDSEGPAVPRAPVQSANNNREIIKEAGKRAVKQDVQRALHSEMMKATMKNIFGD